MKRNILVSNDDGFHAPGLAALCGAVAGLGNITVVAPESEQSGAAHAITVSDPIRIKAQKLSGQGKGYSVTGTPADCVKIALSVIFRKPPVLVLSGINLGPNAGISVVYSGTVSAAAEGTILGIPSIAFSLNTLKKPLWNTAAHVARHLTGVIMKHELPPATMLNVNIPNLPLKAIKGIAITRMARSRFAEVFHRRNMPRGDIYYWMDGELEILEEVEGTDIDAVRRGYVSVTPISFELTNHAAMPELEKWNLKL